MTRSEILETMAKAIDECPVNDPKAWARDCLTALEAKGLAVVQVKPTLKMIFCGVAGLYKTDDPEQEAATVWSAMLTAATEESTGGCGSSRSERVATPSSPTPTEG